MRPLTLQHLARLSGEQQFGVLGLIARVSAFDHSPPITEHILLHLIHGGDKADSHLLMEQEGLAIGYAHLDQTDLVAGPSVELVLDPQHRDGAIGAALLEAAIKICGPNIRLWIHGMAEFAKKLVQSFNFKKMRTVLQMSRSLDEIIPLPVIGEGISIRSFLASQDSNDWLSLNNKVFKDHPEQGNWSITDLNHRLNEEWFDDKGFFIAEKKSVIIGSTWTKIHGAHTDYQVGHSHDHPEIGELYITAVDPQHTGLGVGRSLTITALNYLKYQGLDEVILYVDFENKAAITLYQSLGFKKCGEDVLYKIIL